MTSILRTAFFKLPDAVTGETVVSVPGTIKYVYSLTVSKGHTIQFNFTSSSQLDNGNIELPVFVYPAGNSPPSGTEVGNFMIEGEVYKVAVEFPSK